MKLHFTQFSLLIFVMLTATASQAQWDRQYPMDKLENVLDMDVAGDGYGFATGNNDLLLRLEIDNRRWTLLDGYGEGWNFKAIDYLEGSGGSIAAAGGDGLILTTDKGDNWSEVPGAPAKIHTLKIYSPSHIIVINDQGAFEWENDTWTDLEIPNTGLLKGGFILDYDHIWAFSFVSSSAIYYTTNGGETWNTNTDIDDIDVVKFFDETHGVASDGRRIYTTDDGGVKWDLISTNAIHNSSNDIAFGSTFNVMMAATLNADPSISTNGGLDWTQLNTGQITSRSYSIVGLSDDEFWIGNDFTSILYTENGGADWEERSGPERNLIQDVFYVNRKIGFGLGQDGMLIRTEDGGENWEDISFGNRSHLCMHGIAANDLWMGANQRIFHSADTGRTWKESSQLLGNANDILAISNDRVLAALSTGVILLTVNGGTDWDTVYNAGTPLRCIAQIDDNMYMATGFNGTILRSGDQGSTWNPIASPDATLHYEQVHFLNGKGWMVTSSFKDQMWSTVDAGDNWIPINLPVERFWEGVYFMSQDTGIIVGRSSTEGRALITFNGGLSWTSTYITTFPFYGVTGFAHPNGTAWIYGLGSNIENLSYCSTFPTISDLVGNKFPCEKDTVSYSVTGTNVDDYHWNLPAGWKIIGAENTGTIDVIVGDGAGTIRVSGSNACGTSGQLSIPVGSSSLPEIFELLGDDVPCVGQLAVYTVNSVEVDEFEWSVPAGWQIIGDKEEGFLEIIPSNNPGIVSVTGRNDCGVTEEFIINVEPFVIPPVNVITNDNSLSLSQDGIFYQWFLNGNPIDGANGANYTATESGLYHAEITFASECIAHSDTINLIIIGVKNLNPSHILVYPVPAYEQIILDGLTGEIEYTIHDVAGKIIEKSNTTSNTIDIHQLGKGVYFLFVKKEDQTFYSKFIKQ